VQDYIILVLETPTFEVDQRQYLMFYLVSIRNQQTW